MFGLEAVRHVLGQVLHGGFGADQVAGGLGQFQFEATLRCMIGEAVIGDAVPFQLFRQVLARADVDVAPAFGPLPFQLGGAFTFTQDLFAK